MSERSNAEWLSDLVAGDERETRALSDLRDYLMRAVLVYLRDQRSDLDHLAYEEIRQLAEDLAQEAVISVHENLDTFRGDAQFTTWAYRFVINRAISTLRKRKRAPFSFEDLLAQKSGMLMELIGEQGDDPRITSQRRNIILLLRQIIDSELTELQRMALLSVYFRELSPAEVAEKLDITPNAMYKLLHDARKKIKRQLLARRYSAGDILALFEEDW